MSSMDMWNRRGKKIYTVMENWCPGVLYVFENMKEYINLGTKINDYQYSRIQLYVNVQLCMHVFVFMIECRRTRKTILFTITLII